jgi:acetoin utilization deacetylase AcuC-like enzyme
MTIAIISHPDCLLHYTGKSHPERPERVEVIQESLKKYPFKKKPVFHQAPLADREQLIETHDAAYVDWIFSISPKHGHIAIDADTIMSPHTLNAALRAAGAVILGVDLVMGKKAQAAFCNIRPPGHHAEKEKAMGFCFFNNVAIGVNHAIKKYDLKRVAIIDFDVHHGNGTQSIFQNNKKVMYCSSFQHPYYPGYEPEMDSEHIICVPLEAGTTGEEYRKKVADAWFEKLAAFKPELIFFSAGFDAHRDDPLADKRLRKLPRFVVMVK